MASVFPIIYVKTYHGMLTEKGKVFVANNNDNIPISEEIRIIKTGASDEDYDVVCNTIKALKDCLNMRS